MFPSLFALLYVAHLLADYPFQTDHQAAHKADRGVAGWLANSRHALTHVVIAALVLVAGTLALGLSVPAVPAVLAVLWIGATHAVIDRRWPIAWWMSHAKQTNWAQHGGAAHVDQTAHVTALAIAALVLAAI